MQKTWGVALIACFCCFLWGSASPSIKGGYLLFQIAADDSFSQILFAGCRFVLAGLLALILGSIGQGKVLWPKKGSGGMIFRLCLLQTVMQYFFFYIGMAHTTGVKGSIMNGSSHFIAILLACLVYHYEKLTPKKLAGCIIGFAGVVVINLHPGGFGGGIHVKGEGFIMMAALSYAFSSIYIKKYSQHENPVVLSGYQFILGGLIMIVVSVCAGGRLHPVSGWAFALLLYMAFLSAAAYSLWGILLKYNPVGKVSIFGLTNPIFGALLSALILGERSQISVMQVLLALLLVCGGIYLVNREK